jgi:hypothetical protein
MARRAEEIGLNRSADFAAACPRSNERHGARQQSSPWPADRGFESISLRQRVCSHQCPAAPATQNRRLGGGLRGGWEVRRGRAGRERVLLDPFSPSGIDAVPPRGWSPFGAEAQRILTEGGCRPRSTPCGARVRLPKLQCSTHQRLKPAQNGAHVAGVILDPTDWTCKTPTDPHLHAALAGDWAQEPHLS